MTERAFWEAAWRAADPARIRGAAERFDPREEPLLACLREREAETVCDAGCGCGLWSLYMASLGYRVSGFDLSAEAVALTKELLREKGYPAEGFRAADIRATGFPDAAFDAVLAREVLDHLPIREARDAVAELLRILRPGGCLLLSLDETDRGYESQPHRVSPEGDYTYTAGKWKGMVFHPYPPGEIEKLVRGHRAKILPAAHGCAVLIEKGGACPMELDDLTLRDLQPSQFYISEKKLRDVGHWLDAGDLSTFAPIPVKLLDGVPVMTDGHTRAVAALRAGLEAVPLVWDEDELDWDMYRACVRACRERGIGSPGDLLPRIISEEAYRENWDAWCDRMQAEVVRERIEIRPYTEADIPAVLAFERQLREEEADWGWEIDEAYIRAVTASFHDRLFQSALSLLAFRGGRVVGRIDAVLLPSHFDGSVKAYLDWICVLKSCRHQGVGQALISTLRERLKSLGVDTLIGLTASNEEAQRFYRAVPESRMRDVGIWIDIK